MNQNLIFSGEVYEVESGDVKPDQLSQNPNYIILDTVDTNSQTIGNELQPKKNSMQAMVVGRLKENYKGKPINQLKEVPGYPNSVITNDITIAYAGTRGWQDIKTDVREIGLNDKHSDGAFQSALSYANEIEKNYSVINGYTISTTGHSLGGGEAIYVSALKGYNAITYGAAGAGLSDEQLKKYKGKIINIYDTTDAVTSRVFTGGKDKIPFYSFGIDNAGWKTFGHSRDQFKLDKYGNYIDKYGDIAIYSDLNGGISLEQTILAQQIIKNKVRLREMELILLKAPIDKEEIKRLKAENKWVQQQIDAFSTLNSLRARLTTSGGGLSKNELIFLDDSQALVVVRLVSSKFEQAMETTVKIYTDGITELEQLWNDGVSKIQSATPDLGYDEMMTAMNSAGCTRQTVVVEPSQDFYKKISKVRQMSQEFNNLITKIATSIEEMKQRDHELAQQLRST